MKEPAKRVNIVSLKMVKEASILYQNRRINCPQDAVDLLKPFLAYEDREKFQIPTVDCKNQPTSLHTVSIGSLNSTSVHPREVFKVAVLSNAYAIVLGHNHPSGDPTPSKDDIEITKRLEEAGRILGIQVLDHVILGGSDRFLSFKEQGLL